MKSSRSVHLRALAATTACRSRIQGQLQRLARKLLESSSEESLKCQSVLSGSARSTPVSRWSHRAKRHLLPSTMVRYSRRSLRQSRPKSGAGQYRFLGRQRRPSRIDFQAPEQLTARSHQMLQSLPGVPTRRVFRCLGMGERVQKSRPRRSHQSFQCCRRFFPCRTFRLQIHLRRRIHFRCQAQGLLIARSHQMLPSLLGFRRCRLFRCPGEECRLRRPRSRRWRPCYRRFFRWRRRRRQCQPYCSARSRGKTLSAVGIRASHSGTGPGQGSKLEPRPEPRAVEALSAQQAQLWRGWHEKTVPRATINRRTSILAGEQCWPRAHAPLASSACRSCTDTEDRRGRRSASR